MNKKVKHGTLLTVIFTVLSLLYLYPIVLVFINSFKKKPISVKPRSRYRPERCMSD